MTTYDPNRAAFVKNEYRMKAATDETVKTRFSKARNVVINTQLGEAGALALAQKTLAANERPRTLEVPIEGILMPSDFVGSVPRYIPDFKKWATDGQVMRVVSATVDFETMITTARIRG
jgi:hypothetical protein